MLITNFPIGKGVESMTRTLMICLATLLVGLPLVPLGADASMGKVEYKLYHYEIDEWVRYCQGDQFPPGGATPGTNLWRYEYSVMNISFPTGVYQFMIYFNSDDIDRATYSSAVAPTGWSIVYFPPVAPNVNWKVRFRTTNSAYYVMPGDTLPGYEVEFTWFDPSGLPGDQNYDLVCSAGSEPGVTKQYSGDITPVEATTWGKIKSLFFK